MLQNEPSKDLQSNTAFQFNITMPTMVDLPTTCSSMHESSKSNNLLFAASMLIFKLALPSGPFEISLNLHASNFFMLVSIGQQQYTWLCGLTRYEVPATFTTICLFLRMEPLAWRNSLEFVLVLE